MTGRHPATRISTTDIFTDASVVAAAIPSSGATPADSSLPPTQALWQPPRNQELAFKHGLVREVAYATLLLSAAPSFSRRSKAG